MGACAGFSALSGGRESCASVCLTHTGARSSTPHGAPPLPASRCRLHQAFPGRGAKRPKAKLGWLIALYLQNRAFTEELKPATQRPRRAMLEKLGAEKGHVDIEDVDKGVIQASVNARAATPLMAGAWLYAVKAMFDWATREYIADPATGELKPILADNPCLGVRLPRAPKPADPDEETGHPEFSDNDLDAFEGAYPLGTLERRVYEAIFCSGLRVGDAARFGRQHVMKDGSVQPQDRKDRRDCRVRHRRPAQTGARRRAASAGRRAQFPRHAARQTVGQKLSGLVVRRAVPRHRP
jgi:hypothetical protein